MLRAEFEPTDKIYNRTNNVALIWGVILHV